MDEDPTIDPNSASNRPQIPDTFADETVEGPPAGLSAQGGESDAAKAGPAESGVLGPYQILEEIGRGGMGVVYKAFHPALKRTVALKVLTAGEDASEESISRFHREAEAVAKLGHHPNIVPVYDIGREGRLHYFAMHFVEGKPLDKMIDDGEIAPKRAAVMAKKLADALHHAHENGVLHRDVKPGNIIVTKEGEPQLTDFGLAKDVEAESSMTVSGVTIGTPQYMPPEQADGRLDDIDESSDVFSLGATLYEMLAFHPPFDGATLVEVIRKVLEKDPPSPRKVNATIDRDLETICLKCLEKEPKKRYGNAKALAKDLGRYIEGAPILARPATTWEKLWKRVRRNRALSISLAVIVLLLAGGGFALWAGMAGLRSQKEEKARIEAEKVKADDARKIAENKERETAMLLAKGRKVSRVLLDAFANLTPILNRLKRAHYNSTMKREDLLALYETLRRDVDRFTTVHADDTSASAALAMKGWLLWHGGHGEEALSKFKEARKRDPDVPWASLFEAMIWIAKYLDEQPLPSITVGKEGVRFGEIPGESEGMASLRKRYEDLVDEALKAPVWGETPARTFAKVLEGLRGIKGRNLAQTEEGVSKALEMTELSWIRPEIRLARARIRFLKMEFAKGLEDATDLLKDIPEWGTGHFFRGRLLFGTAAREHAEGKDPIPTFLRAVEAYTTALEKNPQLWNALNHRGTAWSRIGLVRSDRREDAREAYRNAVEDYSASLSLNPGQLPAWGNRGNARLYLAKEVENHGGDPRELLQKAGSDFDTALMKSPDLTYARSGRGSVFAALARDQEKRGFDPEENYRKAIEEYSKVLAD
ncbi:MAG: protein kinase domain-containing protein, partial [Planctomycetota bacterium]